jgi:hypothetical protein
MVSSDVNAVYGSHNQHQFTALQNPPKKKNVVGFEVFTAVAMKNGLWRREGLL